jgi:hypothetical protein
MADDADAGASQRAEIAELSRAEAAAEEVIRQARAEAERMLVAAAERAREIREGEPDIGGSVADAQRAAETGEERHRIFEAARTKIDEMREAAKAHQHEAAERLVALLFVGP